MCEDATSFNGGWMTVLAAGLAFQRNLQRTELPSIATAADEVSNDDRTGNLAAVTDA